MINEIYKYAPHWRALVKTRIPLYRDVDLDLSSFSLTVHNATWCPDCEREVVDLMALITSLGDRAPSIELISYESISEYKKIKPTLSIAGVPTIKISKAGQELGEIIEESKPNLLENIKLLIGN